MHKKELVIPNEEECFKAIGSLENLSTKEQLAFQDINIYFGPIPLPEEDDWYDIHPIKLQPFHEFRKSLGKIKKSPMAFSRGICILPIELEMQFLGVTKEESKEKENNELFLTICKSICEIFFLGMKVTILKSAKLSTFVGISHKQKGKKRYNAGTILANIQKYLGSEEGYCILGITMEDIHHNKLKNWIFGLGSKEHKAGIFSLARYNPCFYGEAEPPNLSEILIYRATKVMVHEIGHMFGLRHCAYYRCTMNPSNNHKEAISRPFDLCPVCLRKLKSILNFDIFERYSQLQKFFAKYSKIYPIELEWTNMRMESLGNYEEYIKYV